MTHHPHRNPIPGPRRLALLTRLKLRRAMLDTGRKLNLTVELARAANAAAGHRRARLAVQGDGQTAPMSTERRDRITTHVAPPLHVVTSRQFRQLIRMDARTNADPRRRDDIGAVVFGMTTWNGYTPPKGKATPRRPMVSAKGVQS